MASKLVFCPESLIFAPQLKMLLQAISNIKLDNSSQNLK
jgi:hypothetical protein